MKRFFAITAVLFFWMANTTLGNEDIDLCKDKEEAAYGLCIAYCEALHCDTDLEKAYTKKCASIEENYYKIMGEVIPCRVCPVWTTKQIQNIFTKFDCNDDSTYCLNDSGLEQCVPQWDCVVWDLAQRNDPITNKVNRIDAAVDDYRILPSDRQSVAQYIEVENGIYVTETGWVQITFDQFEVCKQELIENKIPE